MGNEAETKKIGIAQPSVSSLLLEMQFNGHPIARGTGFVAETKKGPVLLTNRHNVTGRHQDTNKTLCPKLSVPNQIIVVHNSSDGLGCWRGVSESLYFDGDNEDPRWIEHPTLGAKADFVALPLTRLDRVALYPINVAGPYTEIRIDVTDVVSVVGFPFGMTVGGAFPVWATGYIASEPDIDFNDLPVFLIDCRARRGQSGSPVLAYRPAKQIVRMADGNSCLFDHEVSKLLGIYSGRLNEESDLGIVWKTSAIAELINHIDSTN